MLTRSPPLAVAVGRKLKLTDAVQVIAARLQTGPFKVETDPYLRSFRRLRALAAARSASGRPQNALSDRSISARVMTGAFRDGALLAILPA